MEEVAPPFSETGSLAGVMGESKGVFRAGFSAAPDFDTGMSAEGSAGIDVLAIASYCVEERCNSIVYHPSKPQSNNYRE